MSSYILRKVQSPWGIELRMPPLVVGNAKSKTALRCLQDAATASAKKILKLLSGLFLAKAMALVPTTRFICESKEFLKGA